MKPNEISAENWSAACTMARTAALALDERKGGMQVHGVGNIVYFTDPETGQQFKLTVEPVEA